MGTLSGIPSGTPTEILLGASSWIFLRTPSGIVVGAPEILPRVRPDTFQKTAPEIPQGIHSFEDSFRNLLELLPGTPSGTAPGIPLAIPR